MISNKKIILPVFLWLVFLIFGACGFTLDKSHYANVPSDKFNEDVNPLPVTVVINNLVDLRERVNEEYIAFIYLPAVPYTNSHYDRPEINPKFIEKGLNPSTDFANAIMQEMKQNNLFRDITLVNQNDSKNGDLIVTGKIYKAHVDTKATLYGISILGIAPLILGLPQGWVYNSLSVQYEMRRAYDNEVVWKWEINGDWSRAVALYYNYSKDDPYTGMNVILRKGLREGLTALAEEIKHKPLEYWKH